MTILRRRAVSFLVLLTLAAFVSALTTGTMFAQATGASGSIQGTVTDPTGAVIAGARVTITSTSTGQKVERTTTGAGTYSSGGLQSGTYTVRVEAPGFRPTELSIPVQVGVNSSGNIKMTVGTTSQVVEVAGAAVAINTEQPTVQGVLTSAQIENLPVNGRNFLDLAQLEPGVQIQDGGNFDPTKNGFSSVSFGGRAGRTARITVDGVDISDETVGTTTQNVASSTIAEFQMSQSLLDLSTGLTSSGAVNIVTKSGSNSLHGDGFYQFRDKRAGIANFPGGQNNYFQRNQFGGNLGGAIVKDKLFWFADAERVKQQTLIPIDPSNTPFASIPHGYGSPFKDTTMMGKLDWNGPKGMKFFYRFNYNWNGDIAAYGTTYQPFANRDNTPSQAAGMNWTTGNFTHAIRYGWLKFENHIADAVLGNPGVYNPAGSVPVAIRIGGASSQFRFGPSRLAPQATFQENNQIKYDGSWMKGSHIIRYGVDFTHILGGGFASFYFWPELRASSFNAAAAAFAAGGPFTGGSANPLNYALSTIVAGNGLGFSTEFPAFGYPAGGQHDNRIGLYIGDTWKIKSNLTLTYGVRYSRDTGRQDSDLAPLTCSQIPASTIAELGPGQVPCTGNTLLLDQFGGKFGGRVNQPNKNFGPQVGFAWDPTGHGKTSIRGGAGLYFENAVFNNVLFDRPPRLTQGLFFNDVGLTKGGAFITLPSGTITSFPFNGTNVSIASLFGQRIGSVMQQVAALEAYYQKQSLAGGAAANPAFVGAALIGSGVIAPNYKTPESYQMNIGIQREIAPGTVLSADFLRNVGLHYLLAIDTNHVGDVRYFNKAAAQTAIAQTLSDFGVTSINAAISAGATMEDFAFNGLGSGADICGGLPASLCGVSGLAFGGINPLVGSNTMYQPIGRSVYTALQMKLVSQWKDHLPGFMARMNSQVSYSLSRFNTMTGDQDFLNNAIDFANPGRYFGPSALDRTHQFGFGTTMEIKHGPQISFAGHFNSPLAISPYLVNNFNLGEVYYTDLTGDGTSGDLTGGVGDYGRKFNGSSFANALKAYNSSFAGKLTPAAQTLVTAGLFTQAQLTSLGAVANSVPTAGPFAPLGWLKTVDVKLSYPIKIRERFTIYPSIAAFNVFNFVNHDISTAPGQSLVGATDGSAQSVSNATYFNSPRAGLGTGVNTAGAPRQMEFGLRITF